MAARSDRRVPARERRRAGAIPLAGHYAASPRQCDCELLRTSGIPPHYAARTVSRKRSTSSVRRLLSPDRDCADDSTCEEAELVSFAPLFTSVMLVATWLVDCAAPWTLRTISCVALPCCSTEAAM